jgi:hypothetical protein
MLLVLLLRRLAAVINELVHDALLLLDIFEMAEFFAAMGGLSMALNF